MTGLMTQDDIIRWANYLDQGLCQAKELDRITSSFPDLTLGDAYRIQAQGIGLRQTRGEKIVGYKMGLTSKAKREQMGLHTSIYGVLTDPMQIRDGKFSLRNKIHPKIEPEIAFLISQDLRGPVTAEQVLEACSGVCAALEILDSRYLGFKYFSLPDVVADNSSSAYFILGEPNRDFRSLNLAALQMTMAVNGAPAGQALSSEISGNPIHSVVELCDLLASHDRILPAGSVVLAGAATVAVQMQPGQTVSLKVDHLSGVSVTVEERDS